MAAALTKHDNAFEHLIIVPRELHVLPERKEYWEGVMKRCWDGIAEGQGDEVSRSQLSLACWAFLRYVLPSSASVEIARTVLIASDAFDRAEQFCAALFPVLKDKKAAMRIWFEYQEIPLEMASLEYFNPLECMAWEEPLAKKE